MKLIEHVVATIKLSALINILDQNLAIIAIKINVFLLMVAGQPARPGNHAVLIPRKKLAQQV